MSKVLWTHMNLKELGNQHFEGTAVWHPRDEILEIWFRKHVVDLLRKIHVVGGCWSFVSVRREDVGEITVSIAGWFENLRQRFAQGRILLDTPLVSPQECCYRRGWFVDWAWHLLNAYQDLQLSQKMVSVDGNRHPLLLVFEKKQTLFRLTNQILRVVGSSNRVKSTLEKVGTALLWPLMAKNATFFSSMIPGDGITHPTNLFSSTPLWNNVWDQFRELWRSVLVDHPAHTKRNSVSHQSFDTIQRSKPLHRLQQLCMHDKIQKINANNRKTPPFPSKKAVSFSHFWLCSQCHTFSHIAPQWSESLVQAIHVHSKF